MGAIAAGAIIGATLSAGSAVANAVSSSRRNSEIKKELDAEAAGLRSDIVTDKYGNWKYSGANLMYNQLMEDLKDRSRQVKAANKVVGGGNAAATEAATAEQFAKGGAQAAGQAEAQRQAAGLQQFAVDKQSLDRNRQNKRNMDYANSQAQTQAWSDLAKVGGQIAAADMAGRNNADGTKANVKLSPEMKAMRKDFANNLEDITNGTTPGAITEAMYGNEQGELAKQMWGTRNKNNNYGVEFDTSGYKGL